MEFRTVHIDYNDSRTWHNVSKDCLQYKLRKIGIRYDWEKDPKKLKEHGHRPYDRCFFCGNRYYATSVSAFCFDCDMLMEIGKTGSSVLWAGIKENEQQIVTKQRRSEKTDKQVQGNFTSAINT